MIRVPGGIAGYVAEDAPDGGSIGGNCLSRCGWRVSSGASGVGSAQTAPGEKRCWIHDGCEHGRRF